MFLTIVFAPIFEEALFRTFIFDAVLLRAIGFRTKLALALQALAFAVWENWGDPSWFGVVYVFLVALVLGAAYLGVEKSRWKGLLGMKGYWAVVVLHASYNIFVPLLLG